MSYLRGAVWWARIPEVGDKPVVVVSGRAVNEGLSNVIVARITAVGRDRSLPTFVGLEASEIGGLPERSFVICHDLFTLPKDNLLEHAGTLGAHRLLDIEDALRRALDL